MPVALNVGDYLLGEGYRLLAECDVSAEARAEMLRVAALGHRTLTRGQGAELCWAASPGPLKSLEVLEIFREKTAPAFEVALQLGAIFAGADDTVRDVIAKFSRSLGIAYQIRDDVSDLEDVESPSDLDALRPTLLLALAHERSKKNSDERALLDELWRRRVPEDFDPARLNAIFDELGVLQRAKELLEAYKEEAIRSLWDVGHPNLKGLLRRVIGKIFSDTEIKGWCHEFEARNAAGSEAGSQPAA